MSWILLVIAVDLCEHGNKSGFVNAKGLIMTLTNSKVLKEAACCHGDKFIRPKIQFISQLSLLKQSQNEVSPKSVQYVRRWKDLTDRQTDYS